MNLTLNVGNISEMVSVFMIAVMVLSIAVSIITEVTKNTPWLNKIPTELEVIVLSIALSLIGLFALGEIYSFTIVWYMIVATIILGFFASFVIMFGWEKAVNIIEKFKTPSQLRDVYKLTYDEKRELNNLIDNSHNQRSS